MEQILIKQDLPGSIEKAIEKKKLTFTEAKNLELFFAKDPELKFYVFGITKGSAVFLWKYRYAKGALSFSHNRCGLHTDDEPRWDFEDDVDPETIPDYDHVRKIHREVFLR